MSLFKLKSYFKYTVMLPGKKKQKGHNVFDVDK